MKAVKGNMEYTIEESAKDSFQKEGFDIYDNEGNIIAYGAGKVVPIGKYVELSEAYEALSKEYEALRKELGGKGNAPSKEEPEAKPRRKAK